MIDFSIDSHVLSPCQILRQAPYMLKEPYKSMENLEREEPIDIYISSSWYDNGHWMWKIVDTTYKEMQEGKPSVLLAFDESVVLKHNIKSMSQLVKERNKQDAISFAMEFENRRVRENSAAFFTVNMLQQNQRCKQPFYPRRLIDVLNNKKNPYDIPKQPGEIRIVSCDMAFVTRKGNDNSVFSCIRLLPEQTIYHKDGDDIIYDNGYRRVLCYAESIQGGDVDRQALRIRQLFNDFTGEDPSNSFLVLDTRNAGISVYDKLAKVMYDEERRKEYSPLTCMNDENLASRIRSEGAIPCIFAINASQKLNSDIALDFRQVLEQQKIDLLVPFDIAKEEILAGIKEYINSPDADEQIFYESPFLETQAMIGECIDLIYEKKEQTGLIVIREQAGTKDRYTSASYGSYFASLLEKDLYSGVEDYEYQTLIN